MYLVRDGLRGEAEAEAEAGAGAGAEAGAEAEVEDYSSTCTGRGITRPDCCTMLITTLPPKECPMSMTG